MIGELPTRYGDCMCECHGFLGYSHFVACCYPSALTVEPVGDQSDLHYAQDRVTLFTWDWKEQFRI